MRESISSRFRMNIPGRTINFIKENIFRKDASAHKISLGVGLGVFSGLLPGTGPLAALFLAFLFRANRAAALAGSLFTNTWLSLLIFFIAVKTGSLVLNRPWQNVLDNLLALKGNLSPGAIFKFSFLDLLLPLITGYLIVGLLLGAVSYALAFIVVKRYFHKV